MNVGRLKVHVYTSVVIFAYAVTVPGLHHSGRLRGHQRAQRAPFVPVRCSS